MKTARKSLIGVNGARGETGGTPSSFACKNSLMISAADFVMLFPCLPQAKPQRRAKLPQTRSNAVSQHAPARSHGTLHR